MRPLLTAPDAALQNSNVPYLVMVELDFGGGVVRLTNAGYNFTWNGYTWTGTGSLGSISAIEEGTDLQMYGITLTLSGIESRYVAACLNSEYSGRNGTIWLAPLDENYRILANPVIIFKGRMDTMPMKLGKEAAIQVTIESALMTWERGKSRVYGMSDQQSEYPNDLGLEFVAQMVDQEIYWGRPYN